MSGLNFIVVYFVTSNKKDVMIRFQFLAASDMVGYLPTAKPANKPVMKTRTARVSIMQN